MVRPDNHASVARYVFLALGLALAVSIMVAVVLLALLVWLTDTTAVPPLETIVRTDRWAVFLQGTAGYQGITCDIDNGFLAFETRTAHTSPGDFFQEVEQAAFKAGWGAVKEEEAVGIAPYVHSLVGRYIKKHYPSKAPITHCYARKLLPDDMDSPWEFVTLSYVPGKQAVIFVSDFENHTPNLLNKPANGLIVQH